MNIFNLFKGQPMLQTLLSFFKGTSFSKLTSALGLLQPLLMELEQNYINDKDAKNALIDTFIQILQAHKDA